MGQRTSPHQTKRFWTHAIFNCMSVPWRQRGVFMCMCVCVCVCRSSYQTSAFVPKFPKRCPRGSPSWAPPTGWHQRSSLDYLTGLRWGCCWRPWARETSQLFCVDRNECSGVCPGGYLVFRHHGDRDGGRRAPLLQRTPSAGHEEDTGQPAPAAKRVAQG